MFRQMSKVLGTLSFALAILALATRPTAGAAEQLEARLVTDVEAVQPGDAFRVGVLFEMEKGWHIYWKHPGESGLATEVKFDVPKGFEVGPLRWPRPETFTQPGDIKGYGYSGRVLLMAEVTPPKDLEAGDTVSIHAEASWLACKEKCVPGEGEFRAQLPVGTNAQPANEDLFKEWDQKAPPVAPAFTLEDQDGSEVSLSDYAGKVVVLEWINPDCPFVKRHHEQRSTMRDLAREFAPQGVVWLGVNSTHYMPAEDTRAWREKVGIRHPILIDRSGEVARAYDAKTTPHMYVVDTDGLVVYNGGIDDDPRGRSEAPTNYVEQALEDVLAGRPVETPRARPYGCSVKYPPSDS